jgi:dTDP-4-dehydrorhamnose 3,5-epimerase
MKILATHLNDVLELSTPRFADDRGSFAVTFEAGAAQELGLPTVFVQDNHSVSVPVGTLRGLHLQLPPCAQGKLVRVVRGRVIDVVVDLRPGSPTRGRHAAIELDAERGNQLWVPRGFAHGFCTTEPETEVIYKVDAPYAPVAERTLAWNDPTLGIDWPVDEASVTLAAKDAAGLSLQEIIEEIDAVDHGEAS